jgi:hypothetical protein
MKQWFKVAFTNNQAPGAMRNGTRVKKVGTDDPNDGHKDGDRATVLGSIGPFQVKSLNGGEKAWGYFVEWDDMPGAPCFIACWRLAKVYTRET